ncbi:hypothetical protein J2Y63_006679 [Shinella sp. BE166]
MTLTLYGPRFSVGPFFFFRTQLATAVRTLEKCGAEAPHFGYSKADIWAVAACLSTELAGCSIVRS